MIITFQIYLSFPYAIRQNLTATINLHDTDNQHLSYVIFRITPIAKGTPCALFLRSIISNVPRYGEGSKDHDEGKEQEKDLG